MDLWYRISGYYRIDLISADPERTLSAFFEDGLILEDITFHSAISVSFLAFRKDYEVLNRIAEKYGDELQIRTSHGVRTAASLFVRRRFLLIFLAFMFAFSLWLPSRILFIQVEGNQRVATREILDKASQNGVHFGASRRLLRSEKVKNILLEQLPALSWIGINTRGCTATITVKERSEFESPTDNIPGNLVAVIDGIIVKMDITKGKPLCAVGSAVQQGDILVSGYLDLGIRTRVTASNGEVFACTQREMEAVLPDRISVRGESKGMIRKISLIFGKKRIKFYQDSGILYPSCDKMTEVKNLTLPGGWTLPVTLVIETISVADMETIVRTESTAELLLQKAVRRNVLQQTIAGQIQSQSSALYTEEGSIRLRCAFQMMEMIARWTDGAYLEGVANDD